MPPKIRELKAMLRKAGFESRMAKGSHTQWSHPDHPDIQVTVSGGNGDDAQRYQIQEVKEALDALGEREGRQR